jgi:hypothetical protein
VNSAEGDAVRTLQQEIAAWNTAVANAEIDQLAAQYYGPTLHSIATQEIDHAAILMLARPVNLIPGGDIDSFCATAIRTLAPLWLALLPEESDPADRPPEHTGGKIRRRIVVQIAELVRRDPRSVELLRNMQEREVSWQLRTFSQIVGPTLSSAICLEEDVLRIRRLEGLCEIFPPNGNGATESCVQITHAGTEVLQILRVQ